MVDTGLAGLLGRCGEGDSAALKQFFEKYSQDMYNFPIRVFHLDEDAASDFFLYAFERLKDGNRFRSFQGRSSFRTWFYTVLRNLVIDWMRTVKEIDTVPARSTNNDNGKEYELIENIPDTTHEQPEEIEILQIFQQELKSMSIELTVVFKLSYIYYLNLKEDELNYVSKRSNLSHSEVIRRIIHIRHRLAGKELHNINIQDKLTAIYRSIMELKTKRDRLRHSLRNLEHPELSEAIDLEKTEQALEKKYQQQKRLLEKCNKKSAIVRTPYKQVAGLLKIPESNISVQMMRATNKIRDSVWNNRKSEKNVC